MENEEWADYPSEWEDDYEDETDELENAIDGCGYDPEFEGICHHVGTEHCAFWCPFQNIYFNAEDKS